MRLADALLQGLVDHGVQRIFGIPGDFALPLFQAVAESGRLPLHTLSHEPSVGFAADAAARIACAPSGAGLVLWRAWVAPSPQASAGRSATRR